MTLILDAGEGWFALGPTRAEGRVLAAFDRAVYVDVVAETLALVGPSVPPGPMHLRLAELPAAAPGQQLHLDWTGAAHWRPPGLDAEALAHAAPTGFALLDGWTASPLAAMVDEIEAAHAAGGLATVVDRLGGRGPGLTPSGDDVLAGMVLVLALAGASREELRGVERARTHPISLAFLRWAARGQAVEPVHRLLAAVVDGDRTSVRRHQAAVAALGHTSGADLLLGLQLGLRHITAGSTRITNARLRMTSTI